MGERTLSITRETGLNGPLGNMNIERTRQGERRRNERKRKH